MMYAACTCAKGGKGVEDGNRNGRRRIYAVETSSVIVLYKVLC